MENLTNEEVLLIEENVCPDCRVYGHISYGPCGGSSQNITCSNCKMRFNVRLGSGERIGQETFLESEPLLNKNTGINAQRFSREPLEKLFAEEWDKINRLVHGSRPTLPYLLAPDDQYCPGEPSDEKYKLAATVIQWLGSPCGQGFIEDVIQKARDKKIPMILKAEW